MLLCNVRVYVVLCSIAGYIVCFVEPRYHKSNWFLSISVSTRGSDPREAGSTPAETFFFSGFQLG